MVILDRMAQAARKRRGIGFLARKRRGVGFLARKRRGIGCPAPERRGATAGAERGFTLLELIIVVAIIGILATIAMPALKDMPRRANESVLKTNLRTFRDLIDQYYGDNGHYPQSLDVFVEKGYLRAVPIDPMTKSKESWVLIYEEPELLEEAAESDMPENLEPGIIDVRSGSPATALDGSPYAEW